MNLEDYIKKIWPISDNTAIDKLLQSITMNYGYDNTILITECECTE